MTQINQNYEMNNNLPAQIKIQQRVPASTSMSVSQFQIPDFYISDTNEKQTWRDKLKSNPFTAVAYDFFLRGTEHPIPTLLTWLAVSFGLDKYSEACGGKYNTSLVKKAADFGDKIENSNIVKSKPSQFILSGFKGIGNIWKKAKKNSAVLRAISDTPSMPEWSMVKQEMLPHKLKVCEDFFHITNSLHLVDGESIGLKNIAFSKDDKNSLKKFFNVSKMSEVSEEKAANYILLKQIGKNDNEISSILNKGNAVEATKTEILKTLKIDKKTLIDAQKAISNGDLKNEYYDTVLKSIKNGSGKVKIKAGNINLIGPLSRPFERVISCDEIYNKLWSITKGAKTSTGKFMSKIMQMTHRGLTFGQGKWGLLLLIAPSLVDIGYDVSKAEPKQKVGTAVNGFVENISWVFTFPLALHIMHAFGGIQYAGMTPKQVSDYRDIINTFNENNKKGLYKDKAAYDKAKKSAKDELEKIRNQARFKKQNIFTKGLRKIARMFTMDLETFKAREGQNFFMKKIHQLPNFFKNCFGVPVRFGIWSVISMFVLGGMLTKCTSFLFGKGYDSMKAEENKENKKEQKKFLKEDLNERLYKLQSKKQVQKTDSMQKPMALKNLQTVVKGKNQYADYPLETINYENNQQFNKDKIDNYTYIPSQENIIPQPAGKGVLDTYTYIPSQENVLQNDDKNNPNMRKYVPSQKAANINKIWDNSGLESALRRADKAEEHALKILAGNFE